MKKWFRTIIPISRIEGQKFTSFCDYSVLPSSNKVYYYYYYYYYYYELTSSLHYIIYNNYSPKWRWLVLDIYRTAKQ